MKIVYFGTPSFAAEILASLLESPFSIAAAVTQPSRPQGRSLQPVDSPVKVTIQQRAPHIPILQPLKASEPGFLAQLAALEADLFVVVAYGQILPQKLLDIPRLGCLNVHASLLPKYRGAAPMQRCLMQGDRETGVCIQKMVWKLDAGDVLAAQKIGVPLAMTHGELERELCALSKPLLLSVLRAYERGTPPTPHPQAEEAVTYAPKITPAEAEIQWSKSCEEIHNLVRALSPRPGAWCWVQVGEERKRLKILRSHPRPLIEGKEGSLVTSPPLIGCGEGSLELIEVQPEGKKSMQASDWLRGQKILPTFLTYS